jgi:hypothetical protein
VRYRNQLGSTTGQTCKNLGSNFGIPQEAEGEIDHLPETAFWGEVCLSVSGSRAEICAKACKTPPRVNWDLSFSREIVTTEVKGWITKSSVPKRGDSQRTDASSSIPLDSSLGII